MHISFKMKTEGYETLRYLDWHDDEIDYWLNEAINFFVKERFENYKNRSFEQGKKRIEDLKSLLKDSTLTSTTAPSTIVLKPNGSLFQLPSDLFLPPVEESVTYSYTRDGNTTTKRNGITECGGDSYSFLVDSPFSGHRLKYGLAKPLRMFVKDYTELVSDGNYTIDQYHIRYIKKPTAVLYPTTSSDLSSTVHDEIVEKAIRLAMARIGDPIKYQSSLNEETLNQH